jgi:drug/metabolite transporter (DMT)-like permease
MRSSVAFAVLAGIAWGIGGYVEKAGLRESGLAPIVGITLRSAVALAVLGLLSLPAWRAASSASWPAWLQIVLGGGLVAGSLGMWSFYVALGRSDNLGVTLAVAFACAPLAGTAIGLVRRDQPFNARIALGILAIAAGIVLIQLGRAPRH